MQGLGAQIFILVIFILIMYFLLIRPQKKKEKQINDMRNSIQVGDEIVTIGGICGKVVKTKEDSIVIQVGADKVKFEMMRWSVSSVTNPSHRAHKDESASVEEEVKKVRPKKLKKASDVEEAPAEEPVKAEKPAEEAPVEAEKAEEAAEEK